MKWFKILIISILILFFFSVLFYKPDKINLEGKWDIQEIILDNKKIYPDILSNYINFPPQITINGWTKSISIPVKKNSINAKLKYEESKNGNYKIKLTSSEKSLNGIFDLMVDTLHIGTQSYIVQIKIKSNKTLIHFQRTVNIPPWKPPFPKRGQA